MISLIINIAPILIALYFLFKIIDMSYSSRKYRKAVKRLDECKDSEKQLYSMMLSLGLVNEYMLSDGYTISRTNMVGLFDFDYKCKNHVDLIIDMKYLDKRRDALYKHIGRHLND